MSTLKSSAENLTLNADGSGNDIKFQSNAVEKASISDAGLLTTSGGASLDGAVTINDSHADVDFRVESDTITHALFVQGSDGNVGIGTDSPVAKANIHKGGTSGVTDTDDALKLSDADGVSLILENTNTTSGNKNLRIRNNAGELYFERMNDAASSVTSTPMTIAFVDNVVKFDGAIALGGTGTANQMDDYEEGTFTSTLSGGGSNNPSTKITTTGKYTKVGNLVNFWISFEDFNSADYGDSSECSLPFAHDSGVRVVCSVAHYTLFSWDNAGYLSGVISDGGSACVFHEIRSGSQWVHPVWSNDTGNYLWCNGSYRTA